MKKNIALLSLIILLSGCAGTISTVKPGDTADKQKGYLFGQFYQINAAQTRISLILRNLDTNDTDTINLIARGLFGDPEKYGVSSIVPGKYRIEKIEISYSERRGAATYSVHNKKPFTDPVFSQPFEVKAGEKVYLGDFVAKTASSGTTLSWSLRPASTFPETTQVIDEMYRNIAEIPSREAFTVKR